MKFLTKNCAIDVQNIDDRQQGRVMWATDAGKFNNFLSGIIKFCEIFLFADMSVKAVVYIIKLLTLFLLFYILNLQGRTAEDRRNPVAQYFINQSWTLTLILLGTYNILFSTVYNLRHADSMCDHIFRLLLGTVWCWSILIFDWIKSAPATCSLEQRTNTNECPAAGGRWYEFNISLDIFLLIHCALTISEEINTYGIWKKMGEIIFGPRLQITVYDPIMRKLYVDQAVQLNAQKDYRSFTPVITVIVVCLAVLLTIFEDIILVLVFRNYHTVTGTIVAAILAIVGWYINYRIWGFI